VLFNMVDTDGFVYE